MSLLLSTHWITPESDVKPFHIAIREAFLPRVASDPIVPTVPQLQQKQSLAESQQDSDSEGRLPIPSEQIALEIERIDPRTLNELRQQLGLGDKETSLMTIDERV